MDIYKYYMKFLLLIFLTIILTVLFKMIFSIYDIEGFTSKDIVFKNDISEHNCSKNNICYFNKLKKMKDIINKGYIPILNGRCYFNKNKSNYVCESQK
jgi:hypothetical protein